MFLADGGNITFVAKSDARTTHSWSQVGLGSQDMKSLHWSDFEVLDSGAPYVWSSGDCTRTPISQ